MGEESDRVGWYIAYSKRVREDVEVERWWFERGGGMERVYFDDIK